MKRVLFIFVGMLLLLFLSSCGDQDIPIQEDIAEKRQDSLDIITKRLMDSLKNKDQMDFFSFNDILLGDGVPLSVDLAIRWRTTDPALVLSQFSSIYEYKSKVLALRGQELMNEAFNEFESVDSVFSSQRQRFIGRLKEIIFDRLPEDGIVIKEVICEKIKFPETYTDAMKKAGLQRQEMERINQETILAVARSAADKKKAEAEAKVAIAKAQAEGRLAKIKAETEKSKRASQLAAAETQRQVAFKKSQTEADHLKLLAQADLEKQGNLKKLEIEHEKSKIAVEVERKKKMDMADFEVQMELAKVFQNNPVYASYLVNKEMASKVKIAVLPSGSDPNVFGTLLNQTIPVADTKKD